MNILKKRSSRLIIAIIAITGLITSFYLLNSSNIKIKDFNKQRDSEFIKNAFKGDDLYWLVENPDFDVKSMIDNMSPNKKPEYFGKLQIKVLFEKDKHAGFTTYYKKKFYEGHIQFIYVHKDFRNKGYAKKLTQYATNALFDEGVSFVNLVTRINNFPAIKAYEKVGYKEISRDDKFIDFEIRKK